MAYVVLTHATFDGLPNAQHIYDQAKSVAVNASVARIGSTGERTSYCGVYEEQADGTLLPLSRWHIDRFGILRESDPVANDVVPEWVQPAGAQDAYPLTDVFGLPTVVLYQGDQWKNESATNTQTPGVFGWLNLTVPAETEVPAGLPEWKPWTSGLNGDLYQIGDEVTEDGQAYRATLGNNYWQPSSGTGWVTI